MTVAFSSEQDITVHFGSDGATCFSMLAALGPLAVGGGWLLAGSSHGATHDT